MHIKNWPIRDWPIRDLIERLAEGWSESHCGVAQEFLARLGTALAAHNEITEVGDNTVFFTLNLSHIRLRGMDSKLCLLLGDANGEAGVSALKGNSFQHQLPFVFTVTDDAHRQAVKALKGSRHLILSADDLIRLFESGDPVRVLKELLWKRVPRRALVPYSILLPAEGNMFFGRATELERLCEEEFVSFAIAGPSRIGKTSLLLQYKNQMLASRARGAHTRFYISLYNCPGRSDEYVARFIATNIESSQRSHRMTPDSLFNCLRYQQKAYGAPLELLLDEVDEVCEGRTFEMLGVAARMGLCRLILSGRGTLLRMMLSPRSPLQGRLELIQLPPLETRAAGELLLRPLLDMNFEITEADELVKQVLSFTGRLPQLIQFIGRRFVDLALQENTNNISVRHLEMLKDDFMSAQYFLTPLSGLDNPLTRLAALLLLADGPRASTISSVKDRMQEVGVALSHQHVADICNELIINNVLSWSGGEYLVANDGLYFYARKMGFLDGALEETLLEVNARPL